MNYETYSEVPEAAESDFDFDEPAVGSSAPAGAVFSLDDHKALRIAIGGSLIIQGVSVFLMLVIGLVLISNRPRGNFVQLVNGEVLEVGEYSPSYRSPQTVRRFVHETVTMMFTWNGYKPVGSLEESQRRELDPGVAVEGRGRVPTISYYASFALREGLRTSFLRELARVVPGELVRGTSAGASPQGAIGVAPPNLQTVALIDLISEPQKIGKGRWKVQVVCTVVELQPNSAGKELLRFNKELVIRAVEPTRASDEPPRAVSIRAAGLQIEEIKNLVKTPQ